ncbi:EF hand protein (macronuclear) [Tetrahymena thermophila SB210]|uniref:EF hand protein n=1 Tax=Tetrahymena thermophila (strain SB210) TaxID=312017 RepID=W7XHQ7_TETTS|nr:EF hand protein [Tetrahymena thermophila SB210]EWS73976.1 EF hand protein [Tetrahymena thermophila SB210]|eukprot:XP_012653517.1 EF hand protein [Tetrahymena thermophila SB210]
MNFEFKSKFSKFQVQKKSIYSPLGAFDEQDDQGGEDDYKDKLRKKFSTIYNDSSSSQIKDENEDEEEDDDDENEDEDNDHFNNENQNQNGVKLLLSSQKIISQANVQSQNKIKIENPSENQVIDLKLVNQWGQRIIEQKKQNQKLLPVDKITEQALFTFGRFVSHGQEKGENQKLNSTNIENYSIQKSQINKTSMESRFNPVKVINTDRFVKRHQDSDIKKQKEAQKQGEIMLNRSFPLPSKANQTAKEYKRSNSPPSQMPQVILNNSFDPSYKLDIMKFDIQYLQSIKYIKPDVVIQVEEEQRNKIHIFQNSFKIIQLNCKNKESPLTLKIKISNSFSLHLFVGQVEDQCWSNYDQYYCSFDKPIHYNFQEDKQKIYITMLSQSPFCNLELIYYFTTHNDQQINMYYQPNIQDFLPHVEEQNIQQNVQYKKEEQSAKHISVLPAINQNFISKNIRQNKKRQKQQKKKSKTFLSEEFQKIIEQKDIMKCQLEVIKEYYQKKRFAFLKKYSVYYQNITQLNYTHRVLVDIINTIKFYIHNKKYKKAIYEKYESQENCELSNEAINIIKSNQIYLECEENKLLADDIKKYFINNCWQYNPSKQNLNQLLYQLKQALNLNQVGYRNEDNIRIYRRQNQMSFTNIQKNLYNNNGQKQHQNLAQQQQHTTKNTNMYHKQYKEIISIQQSLQQQKQKQSQQQKAAQQNNKLRATNQEIEHLDGNQSNQSYNQVDNSMNILSSLAIIQENQQLTVSQTNYTHRPSIMKIQKIPQNTKGKQNSKQDSNSTGVKKNNQKTKLKLRPTNFDKILKESLKPNYEPFIYQKEFEKEIVLHSYKLIKKMIENKKKDFLQKINQTQKQKIVVKNKIKVTKPNQDQH